LAPPSHCPTQRRRLPFRGMGWWLMA